MSKKPARRIQSEGLLKAAQEAQEQGQLARARTLLRRYLQRHPRDMEALACAAMVWVSSGYHATALRFAQRALANLQRSIPGGLRLALEAEALEAGVRAACHLRNQATATSRRREKLGKTAMAWLERLAEVEPSAADYLRVDPTLDDLREPFERLLHRLAHKV